MQKQSDGLGRIVSVHPISPITMQRATFIAVLSFVFFLATMSAYYVLQTPIYFLLASAFLLIYLVIMFGIFVQRRNILKIHEHGVSYKNFRGRWEEIEGVISTNQKSFEIQKAGGETAKLSNNIDGLEQVVDRIRSLADAHRSDGPPAFFSP